MPNVRFSYLSKSFDKGLVGSGSMKKAKSGCCRLAPGLLQSFLEKEGFIPLIKEYSKENFNFTTFSSPSIFQLRIRIYTHFSHSNCRKK